MTRRTMLFLILTIGVMTAGADVHADELSDLKKRFKQRYKPLVALKDAGKVGETGKGLVGAVDAKYLGEASGSGKLTISELINAENKDRGRLYELIAANTKATAKTVAVRNARRYYKKAKPTHYLKQKDGTWVQKRDLTKK